MPTAHRIATLILGFTVSLGTALAQDVGRSGIAFVEAPEMSSGVCTGADAISALACARRQCVDNGGTDEDCLDIAYCFPARWSVDVFLQHSEGPHWHEFLCGWDSKELALEAAKVACDPAKRPYLIECAAVVLYDEEGNQEEVPYQN